MSYGLHRMPFPLLFLLKRATSERLSYFLQYILMETQEQVGIIIAIL